MVTDLPLGWQLAGATVLAVVALLVLVAWAIWRDDRLTAWQETVTPDDSVERAHLAAIVSITDYLPRQPGEDAYDDRR